MAVQLNHTIVWSSNQSTSAKLLAELLGRPAPTRFGHFDVVELDNGVSLDFADAEGPIRPQHYAFLISEADFDAVFGRIKDPGLEYCADPRGLRWGARCWTGQDQADGNDRQARLDFRGRPADGDVVPAGLVAC